MNSWFQMLSPDVSLRLPASGDVLMDYRPWTNWGISRPKAKAGNPQIEAEVFWSVALPGKQLGKLTDATLALAKLVELAHPHLLEENSEQAKAIQALVDLADEIQRAKDEHKESAKTEAKKAMERLKQEDAEGYQSFVDDLQKNNNT